MERENQLQVFDLTDGHLAQAPRFVKTTLADAANLHPQQIVGPIHVSRDRRFVYLANRAGGTTKLADVTCSSAARTASRSSGSIRTRASRR
jgi:hypothetical protein